MTETTTSACPLCSHPIITHGAGPIEVYGYPVIVIVCLACPRHVCYVSPTGELAKQTVKIFKAAIVNEIKILSENLNSS